MTVYKNTRYLGYGYGPTHSAAFMGTEQGDWSPKHVAVVSIDPVTPMDPAPDAGCAPPLEESMSEELASHHCGPCNAETLPIEGEEARRLLSEIDARWELIDNHHLQSRFKFDDFAVALAFTNRIGAIAEVEGHHPEICVTWGKVKLLIWTHAIDGLSENDFILAAKIDRLHAGP